MVLVEYQLKLEGLFRDFQLVLQGDSEETFNYANFPDFDPDTFQTEGVSAATPSQSTSPLTLRPPGATPGGRNTSQQTMMNPGTAQNLNPGLNTTIRPQQANASTQLPNPAQCATPQRSNVQTFQNLAPKSTSVTHSMPDLQAGLLPVPDVTWTSVSNPVVSLFKNISRTKEGLEPVGLPSRVQLMERPGGLTPNPARVDPGSFEHMQEQSQVEKAPEGIIDVTRDDPEDEETRADPGNQDPEEPQDRTEEIEESEEDTAESTVDGSESEEEELPRSAPTPKRTTRSVMKSTPPKGVACRSSGPLEKASGSSRKARRLK